VQRERARARNGEGAPPPAVVRPQVGLHEIFRSVAREVVEIPVDHIRRDESQARQEFDQAELESLAADIQEIGVQEPVKVKHDPERPGHYVLVFGERRWRACQMAGLATIPALIDGDVSRYREEQLSENFLRSDLNPVELAAAVAQVMTGRGYDTKAMAARYKRPLRQVQRLVEIHQAPLAVKTAMLKGLVIGGERRTLSLVLALDVVRAHRHFVREDASEGKVRAQASLERLIERVLRDEWSSKRLQQHVAEIGRRVRSEEASPSSAKTAANEHPRAPEREAVAAERVATATAEPPQETDDEEGRVAAALFRVSDGALPVHVDRARARRPEDAQALAALVAHLENVVAELKALSA
jgi:ParB/RepB/Spo0J family partition protein